MTLAAAHSDGQIMDAAQFTISARFANAMTGYVRYLGLLVWPADLAIFYPARLDWPLWIVCLASASLVAITALFWRTRRTEPHRLIGWLWFLGVLFPVCGIFQIGSQALADRFVYLPQLGMWCARVWSCRPLWGHRLFIVGAVVILLSLAIRTVEQVQLWADKRTLFEHAIRVVGPQ